jgi:hypothetical protein
MFSISTDFEVIKVIHSVLIVDYKNGSVYRTE